MIVLCFFENMIFNKYFIFIFASFLLFSFSFVFSNETDTRYTDFYFVSWSENLNYLSFQLTWWITGYWDFYLKNNSTSSFPWTFSFVDWDIINYWSTGVRVCRSENEKSVFWNYAFMDNYSFSLQPNTWINKSFFLNFPNWYSGVFYWCLVYYPTFVEDSDSLNTISRKALFIDAKVNSTFSLIKIKAYPGSRGNTTIANLQWFDSRWKVLFYKLWNRSVPFYSGYVDLDVNWSGSFLWAIAEWYYDVVFKWRHNLASFISGVYISWWQEISLDFTTWSYLYWAETWLYYDWWNKYQIAWDMPSSLNRYDYQVNSTDLSVLYGGTCPYLSEVSDKHKCDLNDDGWVDSSDASVIISHDWDTSIVYWRSWSFDWFGVVSY